LPPEVQAFWGMGFEKPEGGELSMQAFKGRPLLVNFWATWCPPCIEEMPTLDKLQAEFKTQNVLFVGIGIDSPSNIRQFLEKTPVSYPIVIGGLEGSNISKQMGNAQGALPYTVIINTQGKATSSKLGKISEEELKSAIKSAL
jgi:thiol-disulfide isomerase/thioredoxin